MSSLRTKQINPPPFLPFDSCWIDNQCGGALLLSGGWGVAVESSPSPHIVHVPVGLRYCMVGRLVGRPSHKSLFLS